MSSKKAIELTDMSKRESKEGNSKRSDFFGDDLKHFGASTSNSLHETTDEESGLLQSSKRGIAPDVPVKKNKNIQDLPPLPRPRLSRSEKERRKRSSDIAQYAVENILSFIDFFQLFALHWLVMFRVPWPTEWLFYTSWTLFVNLDGQMYWFYDNYTATLRDAEKGTADPHFSLWGEVRGWGLAFAGLFAVTVLLLLSLVICIHATKQSYHARRCWQAPWVQSTLQWVFYVLYLPFVMYILRPLACSYSDFYDKVVMDHDTTQECWRFELSVEGWHGIAAIIYAVIGTAVIFYIPIWTLVHLKRHIIFEGRERHEHFLRQKQTEYVLGINDDFMTTNMPFFNNFKQPGTAFRFYALLRKLGMVLVYIFVRRDVVTQLGIMWGIQVLWVILMTVMQPFRVVGSNVVMLMLDYLFLILGLLSLLKGSNTNSDAFVDSTFQLILIVVIGLGLGLALLLFIIFGGVLRCNPIQYRVSNPDTKTQHWVTEILQVQDNLFNLNAKPYELINVKELRCELKSMSQCFHEALEAGHILRYTLQDCMEDVQATLDECDSRAMFPNAKLTAVVPALRTELNHEAEVHALVAPRSRRWLRKLQALRLFRIGYRGPQSDSEDDFADWEEDNNSTINELLFRTQEVLIPPVNTDEANSLKKKWRARIQSWKQEFYRTTGAKPNTDDLWEIDEWRKNYLLLKDATRA